MITVSSSITFSGLSASNVTKSDIGPIKVGIASVIPGVNATDIDNVVVTDENSRLRRALRGSELGQKEARKLSIDSAEVLFDVSVSTTHTTFVDVAELENQVREYALLPVLRYHHFAGPRFDQIQCTLVCRSRHL